MNGVTPNLLQRRCTKGQGEWGLALELLYGCRRCRNDSMVIVYNPMMRIAVLRGGSIVLSVTKGLVRTPNSTKRSQVTVRIIVLLSLEERKCSETRVVKTQLCTQNRTCRSDVVREPHGELLYDFSMSFLCLCSSLCVLKSSHG